MACVGDPVRVTASGGRCTAIALGLVAAWGPAAIAWAAEGPVLEVRWDAPAECPADAFTTSLDRLLAGSALVVPIRVEATVARTDDGWSIVTDFDAGPERAGRRSFQALTCRTVTQAAALAVAIAVDPGVLDRWVPLEDEESRVPEAPEVPEPREAERGAPGPVARPPDELGPIEAAATVAPADDGTRERSRWQGVAGVGGVVDGGALPGLGLGVAVAVGVQRGWLRGEVVGTRRFATQQAASVPGVGGSFTQWWVGARGCGVPRLGAVELPLCAGLEGGRTAGRGTGLPSSRTSAQPWWAVAVDAGLAWPVRRWIALTARATLAVPLLRQTFTINGLGPVHTVGPVQGRGTLGVELRWP